MSVAVEVPFVEVPLSSRGVVDLINRPVFFADRQRVSQVLSVRGDEVFTADDPSHALTRDAVVALPVLGEFVRTHDGMQDVCGYWLGLVHEGAQQGRLEVFVLEESQVRLVSFEPVQVEARQVVSGQATDGERVAMSALLVEAGAHERTKREHADQLERLADAVHAEADERDWCSDFDDFLESQGLPRRSHDYQLRIEVTATVYLSRNATSEDNAINSLTAQEVFDLVTVQNTSCCLALSGPCCPGNSTAARTSRRPAESGFEHNLIIRRGQRTRHSRIQHGRQAQPGPP